MEQLMKTPNLNDHEIFVYQQKPSEYLVYAPLSGVVLHASAEELRQLEWDVAYKNFTGLVAAILSVDNMPAKVQYPEKLTELTILVNYICNFSCTYCYSAHGRSGVSIDSAVMKNMIDYFINPERGRRLQIVFSGGGDPILSFDKVREAIMYACTLADDKGIKLEIGLVTNGSTMTVGQMEFIRKYGIDLVISFDILERVQNAQRSQYNVVFRTIRQLIDCGICPGIRTTVTPYNVGLQSEMVEELHCSFPEIRSAAFEVVLNMEMFANSDELDRFYSDFIEKYFQAVALGKTYDMVIGNTIFNNVDALKERNCLGKLVLTPEGCLTACSRISSPKENHFSTFEYGRVTSTQIDIDKNKYDYLMNLNVQHYPECAACIAKWHCSGGCLLARLSYSPDAEAAYCRLMQRMTAETLERKMADDSLTDNENYGNI